MVLVVTTPYGADVLEQRGFVTLIKEGYHTHKHTHTHTHTHTPVIFSGDIS